MRVEQQVLILVCRFSVHIRVEASVLSSVYCSVQEGQTVFFDIFAHELDILLSTEIICSVKASASLDLILTQMSSTYLNQWLGEVPVKVIKALHSTSL